MHPADLWVSGSGVAGEGDWWIDGLGWVPGEDKRKVKYEHE